MEKIKEYYEEYNYPKTDKLYKIMKADDISISKNDIKKYIDSLNEVQIVKQVKQPKATGKIYAFAENESWQVDIFFMIKYYKQNDGYAYIFSAIDVFTRKAYYYPLKAKTDEDCVTALDEIIKVAGKPFQITSDSDAGMNSNKFQQYLNHNRIAHDEVVLNDHKALRIIDRFARSLKEILMELFLKNKKNNWIKYIEKIYNNYNKTPNAGIDDIKPNEATTPENNMHILELNIWKSKQNRTISDLVKGDKVRIKIKGIFTKGTEPTWSDEVYIVESTYRNQVILNNNKNYKRTSLLKVPHDTKIEAKVKTNIIKEATKDRKVELELKRNAIDEKNIIRGKRINFV